MTPSVQMDRGAQYDREMWWWLMVWRFGLRKRGGGLEKNVGGGVDALWIELNVFAFTLYIPFVGIRVFHMIYSSRRIPRLLTSAVQMFFIHVCILFASTSWIRVRKLNVWLYFYYRPIREREGVIIISPVAARPPMLSYRFPAQSIRSNVKFHLECLLFFLVRHSISVLFVSLFVHLFTFFPPRKFLL